MHRIAFAVSTILGIFIALPAWAQGEILITQAKALAGNVTPGDTAGFPITLTQPGAYILGSNLTVPNGQYGIFAGANNIDIDMNGFLLTGNGVGNYGLISNSGESRVHNGIINRFRFAGIYLRGNGWTIEDMKIVKNGGNGIDATGANQITIRHSLISFNGTSGILGNYSNVVEGNTIGNNGRDGISIYGGRAERNEVFGNDGDGIVIRNGGTIANNSVSNHPSYGIVNDNNQTDNVIIFDNLLLNNNPNGNRQIYRGVLTYGNTCIGKPC